MCMHLHAYAYIWGAISVRFIATMYIRVQANTVRSSRESRRETRESVSGTPRGSRGSRAQSLENISESL